MNEVGVPFLGPKVNWSAQWRILFAYASYLCHWIFLQLLWPSACVGDQGCSLFETKVYTAGGAAQWQEWVILLVLCQHSCGIISQRRQMKHIAVRTVFWCKGQFIVGYFHIPNVTRGLRPNASKNATETQDVLCNG